MMCETMCNGPQTLNLNDYVKEGLRYIKQKYRSGRSELHFAVQLAISNSNSEGSLYFGGSEIGRTNTHKKKTIDRKTRTPSPQHCVNMNATLVRISVEFLSKAYNVVISTRCLV